MTTPAVEAREGHALVEGGEPLPVAQGFGDIQARDLIAPIQIGQGPGDTQYPMVAARRQIHRISRLT